MSAADTPQGVDVSAVNKALLEKLRDKLRSEGAGVTFADTQRLASVDVRKSATAKDVREEQFNTLRPILFYFGLSVAGICVVASIVLVAAMMIIQAPLSDSVAIAMISGLTVETLGIVAIIAHSLFPNQGD